MTKPKAQPSAPKSPAPPTPSAAPRRSRTRAIKPAAEPPAPAAPPAPVAPTSKLETITSLLQRPGGAKLDELMAATGWQAHSVRGALAGAMRKRLGAKVVSEKVDGVRVYSAPQA